MNRALIQSLREQSTWRLLAFFIATLGIYGAHYVARQTRRMNTFLEPDKQISPDLVMLVIVTAYASAIFVLPYFFYGPSHPLVRAADAVGLIANILLIVWGFIARNRMNKLLGVERGQFGWFHGLWTFLFPPLYFNFKVNELHDVAESTPKEVEE